jgi:putative transposase
VRRKRFSVEQIVAILEQAEGGPVADLVRQARISEQTFYRLEEAVRWAGGGADPGQDDATGCAGKKL